MSVTPVNVDLSPVTAFSLKEETHNVGSRWKKWVSAFGLYITSKGVTSDKQKQAILLHSAGVDVQDVFFTLVGEDEAKSYADTLKLLNEHFIPKSNIPFERHVFRRIEQGSAETMDSFVCRLRQQARNCEFGTMEDDYIRDQIVDKCYSSQLRRKLLEKETLTLTAVLNTARAYESVTHQLSAMEKCKEAPAEEVNAVNKSRPKVAKKYEQKEVRRCYRCDESGHYASDPKCPARSTTCQKCNYKGHYSVCCRTRKGKTTEKKAYMVEDENETEQENNEELVFSIEGQSKQGEIKIFIGGAFVRVLIDSGASCNIISSETYEKLKGCGMKCNAKKYGKKLFAYGQSESLPTTGSFKAQVKCTETGKRSYEEFTVVKGSGKTLLGITTATKLNLLRVGPPQDHINVIAEGDGEDILRKYHDVFQGVGKLKNFQLKIHINQEVRPIAQHVRRIPYGLRGKVREQLDDLLQKDIIEAVPDSPTEWVSPLVVVPKSDKSVRICVDMRRANEAIIRERHPIPTVEEILLDLNGATVYSKLDLKWGFHQVELDPESRAITTFITHEGLYRYKRLMFGISSAPEKYQQIIHNVLQGCQGVANIADDIIVYGRGIEEHDANLHAVLERIKESGMTLNPAKCEFRLPKLTFFGHELSSKGISPCEEKIAAIQNAGEPKSASEVRSFLGLVQYSAKFIPDFAETAEPLRKLIRKGGKFQFGDEQKEAFDNLKRAITKAETLAYFRDDCKTRIIADAGPSGLGAVLTQLQGNLWRVISYVSRSLTDVERRYSQTEKEALAVVWACERFKLYCYGRSFELETDHQPLECIYGRKSKPSARIERWVLRLQGYDYNIVYRPGKANIADALSRLNVGKDVDESGQKEDFLRCITESSVPRSLTAKELERASSQDAELLSVRRYILSGEWADCKLPHYVAIKEELCVIGHIIMRGSRIIIPKSMRKDVLKLAHEGHQGIVKTKSRLKSKVWWPKMDSEAEILCRSCHGCQVVGPGRHPEPMKRVRPPSGPWQDLAIDLLGPLPSGENILVVVDYYSRYFEVAITRSTTSKRIVELLKPIISRFGVPFSIKSDNGSQLVSSELKTFCEEFGIELRRSPPLWPQANGEVEIQNKTLGKMLKIAQVEGRDWKEELQTFLLSYRSTPQSTTGASPARLMFGREIRTKLPELRPQETLMDEEIRDRDWQKKIQQKRYADEKRHAEPCDLKPGDKVLLKNTERGKLSPNFHPEPYTVVSKEGSEVVVESKDGSEKRRHSSFVKPYISSEEGEESKESEDAHDRSEEVPMDDSEIETNEQTVNQRDTVMKERVGTEPVTLRRSTRTRVMPSRFGDYIM